MGYYVETTEVNIFLDKKYFDDVYKKMCELNDYDELKRGGTFPTNNNYEGRYNPNKWFSWMAYNYPETCKDMFEILTAVGFDYSIDEDGNLNNIRYEYNKTGNEDYFLSCFAGYVPSGSFICFKGEENEDYFRYYFTDDKMIYQRAAISIDYYDVDTYNFGQMSSVDAALARHLANARKSFEEKNISI